MTHVTDYLAAYLDRQLSESEAAYVYQHLSQCAACRAEYEAVKAAHQEMSRLIPLAVQELHPPEHNWQQVQKSLGLVQRKRSKRMIGQRKVKPSLLMAGLSIVLITLMVLVFIGLIVMDRLPSPAAAPDGESSQGEGEILVDPTVTPIETPTPALRTFDVSQDEAFARLIAIVNGEYSGDPFVSQQTLRAEVDGVETEVTEEQQHGYVYFTVATIWPSTDRPLPEGEEVLIGNLNVILVTGLSGTVDLSGEALHDGSGKITSMSGGNTDPNAPEEISYEDGILIAWNFEGEQHLLLTNLPLEDAVVVARTMISDSDLLPDDRSAPLVGGDPVVLVTNTVNAMSPAWSPDGTRIVFASEETSGFRALFSINVDGSGLMQLTDGAGNDFSPAWSPDGSQIAFGTYRQSVSNGDLYLMNVDGSNQRALTTHPGYDGEPVWSPDGSRIAFYSDRNGQRDIYVMDADGSNLAQLTNSPTIQQNPVWSPDGTRIAYVDWGESGSGDIYVMNADGSAPVQLTDNPGSDHSPAWSPDGQWIAYGSELNKQTDIYVVNVQNPSEKIRVTWHAGLDYTPVWTPDGQWILFSTDRNGNFDLYLAAADGSGVAPLVRTDWDELFPVWSPDRSTIMVTTRSERFDPLKIAFIPVMANP